MFSTKQQLIRFSFQYVKIDFFNYETSVISRLFYAIVGKDGSTVRYVGTVRYASIFAKKHGTLVRYAFFVKVRVRYVGTLFELKIPDFSHITPVFCT